MPAVLLVQRSQDLGFYRLSEVDLSPKIATFYFPSILGIYAASRGHFQLCRPFAITWGKEVTQSPRASSQWQYFIF